MHFVRIIWPNSTMPVNGQLTTSMWMSMWIWMLMLNSCHIGGAQVGLHVKHAMFLFLRNRLPKRWVLKFWTSGWLAIYTASTVKSPLTDNSQVLLIFKLIQWSMCRIAACLTRPCSIYLSDTFQFDLRSFGAVSDSGHKFNDFMPTAVGWPIWNPLAPWAHAPSPSPLRVGIVRSSWVVLYLCEACLADGKVFVIVDLCQGKW